MQDIARQLEQVRGRARVWLMALHLLRFVSALIAVMFVLALLDWALNLPGWLRLVIGMFVAVECVYWLSTRLYRAAHFRPSLGDLALRAERMYPQLSGMLASGVEFQSLAAGTGDQAAGPHQGALINLAINRAQPLLHGVQLSRLIDLTLVSRRMVVALVAVLTLAAAVITSPDMSRTAASRWFAPLGPAQWPKSVMMRDATTLDVWPVDAPVRLVTQIDKGHQRGMRVRVHYHTTDAIGQAGEWNQALMTEQAADPGASVPVSYERLIDLPPAVARSVNETPGGGAVLSYYFQAGDGQTIERDVTLVARPAVTAVHATIQPPVYAAGLVVAQSAALHEQAGPVASASSLIGSRVRMEIVLNKPIPVSIDDLSDVLPGLVEAIGLENLVLEALSDSAASPGRSFTIAFALTDSFSTRVHVADNHGLENLSQRLYRIEAIEDGPPSASITEPPADEAVLATASVDLAATAQDDVGLERIELVGAASRRNATGEMVETDLPPLAENNGRQVALNARATLDLSTMDLRAGDALIMRAVAHDVYELEGQRHEPVRSSPRTLRIIDEPTLVAQLRTELAGLRQQVVRLEQTQQRIQSEQPPSVTLPQQEQVTQRLDAQASLLERLDERVQRNRLEDAPMRETINQADALVRQARRQSSDATTRLGESDENQDQAQADELEEQAHEDQKAVRQTLAELADLLDQGRDVLTLKLQLQQLKTQQQSIATDTRELLPQTIGQDRDQLDESQQQQLDELDRRQEELVEQAQGLTRQMQLTADALARQGERDQDRAAAEALAEAAAIGQRQGLEESMSQASESIERNQLSQSGQQQDQAMNTLDRMLEEMGTQERRRQAILRRRVQELAALVRKLIERQGAHADRVEQSAKDQVAALEPDQVSIRRASMGAQQEAAGSTETEEAQSHLAEAVREQGTAVGALREGNAPPALVSERQAIDHLKSALESLEKVAEDTAAQEARKKREQLREAYLQHAKRQEALRDSVTQITDAGPVDRQRRAALVALSGDQSQLQQAIAETGKEVDQTLVFIHMHEQVGISSSRVVSSLRRGEAGAPVASDQRTIASTLRAMAEALKEDPSDSEFADAGGGGGGGGGDNPPLVPPITELKLIRGLQQLVYDQTREAESAWVGQPDEPMKQQMLELSTRQRELSGLGKRLIQQMQQQRALPGLPTGDQP